MPMTPAVEVSLSISGQDGAAFSVFRPVYDGRKFQSGRKAVIPPQSGKTARHKKFRKGIDIGATL
ncbi:MAG: hypothetical protein JXL20_00775 [Deltaproteobacteria bacterium]|nr:hypothetical protein [Deltaproteobacteria bacterium]